VIQRWRPAIDNNGPTGMIGATPAHFTERVRGSHHIFTRDGVEEILNVQSRGNMAKPYQVKQVRQVILKYKPGGSDLAVRR
jgi:hypothetical protein